MMRPSPRVLAFAMLATVCGCAATSSTPSNSNPTIDVSSTINGKVAPDANGNNRDQPNATDSTAP